MKVFRYRLTALGKLGAVLFVAPTPIAALYALPAKAPAGQAAFNQRLQQSGADIGSFSPSPTILILLATASLIGIVLLLIGREIITSEA
jgi:hypothetical protein